MYRIAVLAEQEAERQRYAEQITRFCEAKGLFPQVMQYDDQERFFETAQKEAPTNAVIALSGVAGLNAAEHLRSLFPACRMIWCSDLDSPFTPSGCGQTISCWSRFPRKRFNWDFTPGSHKTPTNFMKNK